MIAGDVGTDGLGLDDADRATLASCDIVVHSAATVAFDSPLDGAVEVNLLGPSRIARTLQDLGAAPPPDRRVDLLRRRQPQGGGPRGAGPSTAPSSSTSTGSARSMAPAAPAGTRSPRAARPEALARFRKQARHELGAAGTPALAAKTEQRRQTWVKDRMVEAGRARAASLGWPDAYAYTKALGERALLQQRGDAAGVHRAAVDHRIGVGRAPARLDPRLPHGRAHHHQLRPRPASGVSRRARGHRGRHPRRPGGRRGGRGRGRRAARGRRRSCRWRRDRPTRCATGTSSTWCASGSSSGRCTTPRGSRSSCPTGRSRGGGGSSASWCAPRAPSSGPSRRCSRCRCGAGRRRGRPSSRSAGRMPSGRSATSSSTAPTPNARRSTGSTACSPCGTRSAPTTRPLFCFDPRVIDWRTVRARGAPSVGGPARPRADHAGRAHQREPPGPAAPPGARPRAALRRVRPREHAHRLQRGGLVLVARHPAAPPRRPCALRAQDAGRGAVAAGAGPAGPQRLPAPLLPALRPGAHRPARRRLERDVQPPAAGQVVPRRDPPGPGASPPRPPHAAHHRRARLRHRPPAAALRRRRVRPAGHPTRRHLPGRARGRAAHGRGPGARCSPTTPPPMASTWRRRSPTPTPPATCPCWRRSGSRWR